MGLAGIFSLVSIVSWVVVLIHAFKSSTGQGFMCLCIPCYVLYYMFAKFEHPRKPLVIGGDLGGSIASGVCQAIAGPRGTRGGGFNNM